MNTARLISYSQGFGADVFIYHVSTGAQPYTRIKVIAGWGLLAVQVITAYSLTPEGEHKEQLGRWEGSKSPNEVMRELGYERILIPPWLNEAVQEADEIK